MLFPSKGEKRVCLLLLLLLISSSLIHGFRPSDFINCKQSDFCDVLRSLAKESENEFARKHTARIKSARVINTREVRETAFLDVDVFGEERREIEAGLQYFGQGIHRVLLKRKDKEQYHVQDVILERAVPKPATLRINSPFLTYGSSDHTVVVEQDGARMKFEGSNGLRIILNQRGLLSFDANTTNAATLDIRFEGAMALTGIPEHCDDVVLKDTTDGEPYRLHNADVFEYEVRNRVGLYGTVPFIMALGEKGAVGVLVLNAAQLFVDVKGPVTHQEKKLEYYDTHWMFESGVLDVFVFEGPTPRHVLEQLSFVTGSIHLPPMFSVAYHQCRWNYKDDQDVMEVNTKFDENDIPLDVIWLDIEHTNGKKYFTWDSYLFPEPIKMQNNISSFGRKMVTISDPHIKRENGYFVFDEGTSKGYFVKRQDGSVYEGKCWPGMSSWVDFLNPDAREWYAGLFSFDRYPGATNDLHTWIDMNEPSVFDKKDSTMEGTAVHHGNVMHRDVHNQYGFYHAMTTYDGLQRRSNGQQRPFILTRSFFAGSQRFSSVWTGDNTASWEHMEMSVPMLITLGLSGISFSGGDVGGFFGDPDAELFTRWFEIGAFQPFYRGHAHIETKRREPYAFGNPTTSNVRNAIRKRYQILPYLYTQFFVSSESGIPIMRPVWWLYYENNIPVPQKDIFSIQDKFLVGSDLLVVPVLSPGVRSLDATLPIEGMRWYDTRDFALFGGGRTAHVDAPLGNIPVFQRGGSIVPRRERARRSSAAMVHDPITLHVALDEKHEAKGVLYEDDGASYNYVNGCFRFSTTEFENSVLRNVPSKPRNLSFWSTIADRSWSYQDESCKLPTETRIERIVVMGLEKSVKRVVLSYDGDTKVGIQTHMDTLHIVDEKMELDFSVGRSGELIIRDPHVLMHSKWTISFE